MASTPPSLRPPPPRGGHHLHTPGLRSQVSTALTSGTFYLCCCLLACLEGP